MTNITESDIENYLVNKAKKAGFLVRKCQWIGANHCPDRLIMSTALTVWVEVKAPGKLPTAAQMREHNRMGLSGQIVYCINSREQADKLIEGIAEANKQLKGILNDE